jgi:CubicO group peptidase (beta-lactamase class C family)
MDMIAERSIFKTLRPRLLSCIATLLGCLLASGAPAQATQPTDLEELHRAIETVLREEHVPGGAVALVDRGGAFWSESFGVARIGSTKPIDADTVFRVGSVGKSMVALALLKLQEQGKLTLDTPVQDIAPGVVIENQWQRTSPVRIANLLEHTAGFDDMWLSEVRNVTDDPYIPFAEIFRKFPGPQRVRWSPGTMVAYSNPGYAVAGYVIEVATGETFEKYLKDEVLDSVGMRSSDWRLTEEMKAHMATGHEGDPPTPMAYFWSYMRPGGELKSTAKDLSQWVSMLLNRGRTGEKQIVSAAAIERMERTETSTAARAGLKYGLGAGIESDYSKSLPLLGKGGAIDGFVATYQYSLKLARGYVVLLNADNPAALERIERLLVSNLNEGSAPSPVPTVSLTNEQLEQLAGFYVPINPRLELGRFIDELTDSRWVTVKGRSIFDRDLFGDPQELLSVSDLQFRHPKDSGATRIFVAEAGKQMVLAGRSAFYQRESAVWPLLRLAALLLSLTIVAIGSLALLVRALVRLRGKFTRRPWLLPYGLAALVLLCLIAMAIAYSGLHSTLEPRGTYAYVFYSASLGIPIVSFVLVLLLGHRLLARVRSSAVPRVDLFVGVIIAAACVVLSTLLSVWHMAGYAPWKD